MKQTKLLMSIAAIVPVYGENGGNSTRIYFSDGSRYDYNLKLKTVLNRLARYFNYSLTHLRENYGTYLCCRHSAPLPLNEKLVLVPFKARIPHWPQDGSSGYVNLMAVEKTEALAPMIEPDQPKCQIHLKGDTHLACYITETTLQKRFQKGRQSRDYFLSKHGRHPLHDHYRVSTGKILKASEDQHTPSKLTIEVSLDEEILRKLLKTDS